MKKIIKFLEKYLPKWLFNFLKNFVRKKFFYDFYSDFYKSVHKNKNFISKNLRLIKFDENDSFKMFSKKVSKIPDFFSENHFRSQYSHIYKNKKCWVDYIGRFENIEKDFEPIRKNINLKTFLISISQNIKKKNGKNIIQKNYVILFIKDIKKILTCGIRMLMES